MRQHLDNRVAAGMDGADPSSLLQVISLDTRNRIRSKEHPVVAFGGAVDARSRTVRIVASSEDDGVHAEGGKVLVQSSSVEGTPAWFPDSNLVRAEVLQMACDGIEPDHMDDRRSRIPVRREQAGDVRLDLGGSGDRAGATVDEIDLGIDHHQR
jgi:hypothetical protein